jgi:hypothetical protein
VVAVDSLTFKDARRADLNEDGQIDARDIRAFARRYNMELLPQFDAILKELEAPKRTRISR